MLRPLRAINRAKGLKVRGQPEQGRGPVSISQLWMAGAKLGEGWAAGRRRRSVEWLPCCSLD